MAFLLVVIFVLVLLFAVLSTQVSTISKTLADLLVEESAEEKDLRKQLKQLAADLKTIHMVDEFAKYAKTERKINKLKEEISTSSKARTTFMLKMKSVVYVVFHVIRALCFFGIFLFFRHKPVLQLPEDWVFPVGYLLSLPIGVSGYVSVLIWMVVCRNVVNTSLEVLS